MRSMTIIDTFHRTSLVPILTTLALVACTGGEDDVTPNSSQSGGKSSLRSLLARGVAHAEIGQWVEAGELFQQAAELDPAEPAAAYDLAVASFQAGDRPAAGEHLERAGARAPTELLAKIELLRAKLAYEDGDAEAELAAHREAARLAPGEAAYAHALGQLYVRLGQEEERGAMLELAHELWPENSFLAAELALWALGQAGAPEGDERGVPPERDIRRRGLAVLETLIDADSQAGSFLEKGRGELEAASGGPPSGVPRSLRIAVNLLRATKRFQSDAADLQSRLELTPLAEPVSFEAASDAASPEIRFDSASLLPDLSLETGEQLLDAMLVDDSTEDRPGAPREAGLALLSDQGIYVLSRQAEAFSRLADVAGARQLLAGDVDDDERMELLLLSADGVRLWSRGPTAEGSTRQAVEWREIVLDAGLAQAADLRHGLLTDFEHDGDLDLLAVDGDGRVMLATNRGEAGLGPAEPATLPVEGAVRRLIAADLDADADQDLLLAGDTELLVLRNWRQGEYLLHAREPLPKGEEPSRLLTLDYDADGSTDVVALTERGLAFWRGDGRARLLRDAEAAADTVLFSDALRPRHLTTADLDLDGDLDLLVAGVGTPSRGAGVVALINDGGGRFAAQANLLAKPWPAARGTLALDLDGDHDPDLLSWTDAQSGAKGSLLRSFRGSGAEDQGWLTLRLRSPERKVPRDGRGVRLQVVAGDRVQWLELERPNVTLGLGTGSPAVIKATWPNGISEYLFEPEPEAEHTLVLSLRVEGSCPFLYASDGEELRFVTDILGLAPVGMIAASGSAGSAPYVPADPEEYLRLPEWVTPDGGTLELAITEELREALYLDQTELVAVDAPREVKAYNGEQWLPDTIRGLELRLLATPVSPDSVLDDRGREVLDVVRRRDHRYLTNHRGPKRYQGAVAPHRLTVELPPEIAGAERPALVLVGWLHWANTSTNVARSQDPNGTPMFPLLEVPDGDGGWRRVATAGLPAGKTKPVIVDLTGLIEPSDPRLRLTTDFEVYWDWIAVSTLMPSAETSHRVHRLSPRSAELRWGGFSRWFRPAANGPYLFDYGDRRSYPSRIDGEGRDLALSWQELEGYYTAYGPVTDLLERADDRLAVIASGEEVKISFDVASLPALPDGWRRTFFLHSEGWEKDGDPNVSCSRTVAPLPYRGMSHDPCSGLEAGPSAAGAPRTRWVDRDRLARRVAARASGWDS